MKKNKLRVKPVLGQVPAVVGLVIALFIGSCSNDSISSNNPEESQNLVAVNDDRITVETFRKELKILEKKFRVKEPGKLSEDEWLLLKTQTLNQMIQKALFLQEAAKAGITVTAEEWQEAHKKATNGYQEDTFEKFLELEGIPPEEWDNKLKNNMLINKLINLKVNSKVSVSDQEVAEYFEDHKEEFHTGEQVRALHIMVETEGEARDIQKLLKDKKKDFATLAKKHSLGPEGAEGGDLGYFEKGQMPEEFDDVFKLKVNQTSDVIQTPYGFHLFKVIDKKADQKMELKEARDLIHRQLLADHQNKAFKQWLAKLKEEATIEVNYNVLAQIH